MFEALAASQRFKFKMSAVALVIFLGAALMAPVHAWSAATRDVLIVNHAAAPIVEVYVSGVTEDTWGDDRLGQDPVAPGRSWRLATPSVQGCSVDIRVVYGDGRVEERRQFDLCRSREIAFNAAAAAVPHTESVRRVTFNNRGRRTIVELYLSAATSDNWGEDRLTHPLPAGAQVRLDHEGGCVADLRIVFDNRAAEERRRVDVCRNSEVAIKPGWTTSDGLAPADDATAAVRPDHRT